MDLLIDAAKRYEAAITIRGSTRTQAEAEAAWPAVEEARRQLQEAVLDLGAVNWLARLAAARDAASEDSAR